MDRAAGAVAVQLRHVKRLGNDPLPRESGVAVNEQRQHLPARFRVLSDSLPGPGGSFDDRIHGLEMARVRREANLDFGAVLQFSHRPITQMVFHVAVTGNEVGNVVRRKFREDKPGAIS